MPNDPSCALTITITVPTGSFPVYINVCNNVIPPLHDGTIDHNGVYQFGDGWP